MTRSNKRVKSLEHYEGSIALTLRARSKKVIHNVGTSCLVSHQSFPRQTIPNTNVLVERNNSYTTDQPVYLTSGLPMSLFIYANLNSLPSAQVVGRRHVYPKNAVLFRSSRTTCTNRGSRSNLSRGRFCCFLSTALCLDASPLPAGGTSSATLDMSARICSSGSKYRVESSLRTLGTKGGRQRCIVFQSIVEKKGWLFMSRASLG